jgi:hypothetical protein
VRAFIAFMAWQIEALPYIAATSFGLGMILLGCVFFSKKFWPEIWDDERT